MADTNRIPSYGEILEALDELPGAVRAVRRMRGLSVRTAAVELDVSAASVSRFERGERGYNSDVLVAVLRWLDAQLPAGDSGKPRTEWSVEPTAPEGGAS